MKSKNKLLVLLSLALTLPAATVFVARAAVAQRAARAQGPCDIYAAGGTPCVAAHSTTRALSSTYNGPLYQVMRQSDGATRDIGLVFPAAAPGAATEAYADAAAQDAFCANTLCVITRVYDQSGKGNHLYQAPPGTFIGPAKGGFNTLPIADMAPITVNGHKAYGVFIMPGMGLRNNDAAGLAINDEPEGIYYVIDGTHYDSGCCFDYGNSSTNSRAVGTGTMETTYFGTATAWGKGAGPGPWIMADMEAGLFSGYNAKENVGSPTIDSWRFVTAVVNGGGGNKWDLRGGNAQQGSLTTFYSGVRPGTPERNAYFPMNKKGGLLLGNGGDNGNGSSGTFYEGVMTTGYPTDAATDAVQANIVAAKYAAAPLSFARVTTFTPGTAQPVTVTFTNTTGAPVSGVTLSLALPGWTPLASGTKASAKTFPETIAPGASVSATFDVTPPAKAAAGFLAIKSEWKEAATGQTKAYTLSTRVRSAPPVKINEVFFGDTAQPTNQFIELYNASASEVDISGWKLTATESQWAGLPLATIPAKTKVPAHSFYILGLAPSGTVAPTPVAPSRQAEKVIYVRSTAGLAAGQTVEIGNGGKATIATVGTAAAPKTTLFIPVSTGPSLTIPAGSTNVPVTSAAGFVVGEKIGFDLGGNYEEARVTAVGKAATQTTLTEATVVGATSIKLAVAANISVGDTLIIDTGARKELAVVKSVTAPPAAPDAAAGAAPGGGRGGRGGVPPSTVELTAPLKLAHMNAVDVSDRGTGISFTPATYYAHTSGESVQALGSGVTLASATNLVAGAPLNFASTTEGFQGTTKPNQWFGMPLSPRAGSLALTDASGDVIVDAIVYGSQQTSSSANGTITSPELATLEGNQRQGGSMAVVPTAPRGGRGRGGQAAAPATPPPAARGLGRVLDGADNDSLAADFQLQLPTPGAPNQRAQ